MVASAHHIDPAIQQFYTVFLIQTVAMTGIFVIGDHEIKRIHLFESAQMPSNDLSARLSDYIRDKTDLHSYCLCSTHLNIFGLHRQSRAARLPKSTLRQMYQAVQDRLF